MRIVLWAAIPIIGYRRITAIVLNETPSSASSGNGAAATPAPSGLKFRYMGELQSIRGAER
jgi:hypothetical protein